MVRAAEPGLDVPGTGLVRTSKRPTPNCWRGCSWSAMTLNGRRDAAGPAVDGAAAARR